MFVTEPINFYKSINFVLEPGLTKKFKLKPELPYNKYLQLLSPKNKKISTFANIVLYYAQEGSILQKGDAVRIGKIYKCLYFFIICL